MLKQFIKIFSLITIFICSSAYAESKADCVKPTLSQEMEKIIAELNAMENTPPNLLVHVFKTIPKEYVEVFYIDMSAENRTKLWEYKIRKQMKKDSLTLEQTEFIERAIVEMGRIQSLDSSIPDNVDYVNSFFQEALQFLSPEQTKMYFYNIYSIVDGADKNRKASKDEK